jgi:type IV secretory pathway VirB3-like protein
MFSFPENFYNNEITIGTFMKGDFDLEERVERFMKMVMQVSVFILVLALGSAILLILVDQRDYVLLTMPMFLVIGYIILFNSAYQFRKKMKGIKKRIDLPNMDRFRRQYSSYHRDR